MTDISINFLPSAEISTVEPLWKQLESRAGGGWLTNSWTWVSSWLESYGGVIPHEFAIGQRAGRPCAIALLTRSVTRRGPFKINTLHLGTSGESEEESVCVEHNRVLADADLARPFATALLARLKTDSWWDELDFDGFDDGEIAAYRESLPTLDIEKRLTRVFDFAKHPSEQEILPTLSKKTRQKLTHSFKVIGDVSVEWMSTPDQAADIFNELVQLHQKRWQSLGKPGAFASERFLSFHKKIIERLLPSGGVFLFRVKSSLGTLGCLYGFIENNRVRFYQSGFSFFEDNKIAPGSVTVYLCLEECRKRGLVEFDFLEGDNLYKRQLSNVERYLNWGRFRRPRLKFMVINVLKKVRNLKKVAVPSEVAP